MFTRVDVFIDSTIISEDGVASTDSIKVKIGNMKIVILTGKDGGKLKGLGDVEICVPHFGYADRIQEIHIKIIHTLILSIEQLLIIKNEFSN
jgi:D-sedoheptulose 7-phosphate isomerase